MASGQMDFSSPVKVDMLVKIQKFDTPEVRPGLNFHKIHYSQISLQFSMQISLIVMKGVIWVKIQKFDNP